MTRTLVLLLALAASPVAVAADRVDEVGWWTTLSEKRPELLVERGGDVDDPGWRALVLHPRYRAQLLAPGATWETVLGAEYTPERRERDRLWAVAVRAAHRAVQPAHGVQAGGVDDRVYVGYRVGDPGSFRGDDGYVRKLYLSFDDPERDLSAARLAGFAQHLAALGVDTAFKVDLRPGLARFTYNQLILYLGHPSQAACIEAAALTWFGDGLSTVGRGVDPPLKAGERPQEWHHFLLSGGYEGLPAEAKTWLEEATAPSPSLGSCPA